MATTVVNLRKEKFDVFIGRPSKWGNPFVIGVDGNREQVIELYRQYAAVSSVIQNSLWEIKGKRLGCYCKPKACHGDILAEMADR
jgi:hypothetical protein